MLPFISVRFSLFVFISVPIRLEVNQPETINSQQKKTVATVIRYHQVVFSDSFFDRKVLGDAEFCLHCEQSMKVIFFYCNIVYGNYTGKKSTQTFVTKKFHTLSTCILGQKMEPAPNRGSCKEVSHELRLKTCSCYEYTVF